MDGGVARGEEGVVLRAPSQVGEGERERERGRERGREGERERERKTGGKREKERDPCFGKRTSSTGWA